MNNFCSRQYFNAPQFRRHVSHWLATSHFFLRHLNHTLFWENLCSKESSEFPSSGALKNAVDARFGNFDAMKKELSTMTIAVQGSGWGWLGYNTNTGRIETATCANQDPLKATTGLVPLLGIDVWEHAYYVDYRNVRPNYVNAIFDVVNWKVVEERLVKAQGV
jgi:Fe-Mn family superoxide dismutase